jgi:hypothetical protein
LRPISSRALKPDCAEVYNNRRFALGSRGEFSAAPRAQAGLDSPMRRGLECRPIVDETGARSMVEMSPPAIYLQLAQAETEPEAEAPPVKIDVTRYIPHTALEISIIVTVTPPTGAALVYAPGYENQATLFKGPKSGGDVRLAGPFIYVKLLAGATSFQIQYLRWREP